MDGVFVKWDKSVAYPSWKLNDMLDVLKKVKRYYDKIEVKDVFVLQVEEEPPSRLDFGYDRRINIDVCYVDETEKQFYQRLVMIDGRLMDGDAFHKFLKRKEKM